MKEVDIVFMNIQGIYTITGNLIKENQLKQINENILNNYDYFVIF